MRTHESSFFARVRIYCNEMFPVHIYLPYVVALYACLSVTTQLLYSRVVIIDTYGVVGLLSAFCMMLLLRTFDDLKDFEIDKDLFPERAIPRGDVRKSDITTLSVTSFVVLMAANLLFARHTLVPFFIMVGYALLTFKWFFAEAIHRKNLFLTMLTHQPLPLFINAYLISTALYAGGREYDFSFGHILLLLLFSLPVTAWEVGRKIRAADMETDYVTFSRIFGASGAATISLALLSISGFISLYMGWRLHLPLAFYLANSALLVFVAFVFIRFILHPEHRNNVLKNAVMIFTTLLFFNLLLHTLFQSEIKVLI